MIKGISSSVARRSVIEIIHHLSSAVLKTDIDYQSGPCLAIGRGVPGVSGVRNYTATRFGQVDGVINATADAAPSRGTDGLSTHRWREPDSNHRSRSCERSRGCCRREMPDR